MGQARQVFGAGLDLADGFFVARRFRLAPGQLRLRQQSGHRGAQLMGGVVDKSAGKLHVRLKPGQQIV